MALFKKKKKLQRYTELTIDKDTIVPFGAMGVKSVFKENQEVILAKDGSFKRKLNIFKFDDSKQEMANVMVLFGKEDSQGMILDNPELRDSAFEDFQKNGDKVLKFTHNKDEDGNSYDIDAEIIKSWVVEEGDEYFPEYVGSIARIAKFNDKAEYDIVKEMEWESSIEGKCKLESITVEKANKNKIKDLLKKIYDIDIDLEKRDLEKDFDTVLENRKNNDFWFAFRTLDEALWNEFDEFKWYENITAEEFKNNVKTIVDQFAQYVNDMTFEVKKENPQTEEENEMDVKELKKEMGSMFKEMLKEDIPELVKNAIPVEKDAEGNVITKSSLLDAINKQDERLEKLESNETIEKDAKAKRLEELQKEMDEIKKGMGVSHELAGGDNVTTVEKSSGRTDAQIGM